MIRFRGVRPAYDDSIILIAANNPLSPEIEYTSQKIPLRPGVFGVDRTHNARVIDLTFELNGKSATRNALLAAQLIKWADSDADGQLIFDEQPDRYYQAILTSVGKINYAAAFPEVNMTFTCANPYGFAAKESTAAVGMSFIYSGDAKVYPVIEHTPESNISSAQWSDGTRIMRIQDSGYTITSGHVIKVDNATRVVTDNGSSIMQHITLLSDWLYLKKGENTIQGTGGVVKWRDIYL
jgi:predicted phage tail component-like protein